MSRFRAIAQGLDVSAINAELDARPDLWGQNGYRTADPSSPHRGVRDIWLRWRPALELISAKAHQEPHFAAFWPAWGALPSLHPIVRNLAHVVSAVQWGGVLITETPAGGQVEPHIDTGWHPTWYDTKLYLVLQSNPRCLNFCDGDVENFRAGDVWEYPNNVEHSVVNDGPTPHRNVIICFRSMAHDLRSAS